MNLQAPEFRRCPVTGRTVVLAPGRADRPNSVPRPPEVPDAGPCPFCPGNEDETPPELFAIRDANGWQLRVVPNKFPAVDAAAPAFGFHEVLVECPEHFSRPTELGESQFANIFRAYRERLLFHAHHSRIESVTIFKNVGTAAGASLSHSHSQLIALPFVPAALLEELGSNRCEFCRMTDEPSRVVAESEKFVVLCPFAPRFAYEMWAMPKDHEPRFESIAEFAELAGLVKRALVALDRALNFPAFNWYLHTAPRGHHPDYHWHVEIVPRLSRVAGFEWGSGIFINDVVPERAAAELRHKLPA